MVHCWRAGASYGINLVHVTSWECGPVEITDGDGRKVNDLDLAVSLTGGGEIHLLRSQHPAEHDALHRILMTQYEPLVQENHGRPTRVK